MLEKNSQRSYEKSIFVLGGALNEKFSSKIDNFKRFCLRHHQIQGKFYLKFLEFQPRRQKFPNERIQSATHSQKSWIFSSVRYFVEKSNILASTFFHLLPFSSKPPTPSQIETFRTILKQMIKIEMDKYYATPDRCNNNKKLPIFLTKHIWDNKIEIRFSHGVWHKIIFITKLWFVSWFSFCCTLKQRKKSGKTKFYKSK